MTRKIKLLEKYLNYLFIILFPSQLALHFWPKYSFIYGIRIDYYSIAFYLTDVIFAIIFLLWFINSHKIFLIDIKRNKKYVYIFAIFLLVNIIFSTSVFLSLFKWVKLIEYLLIGYYLYKRKDVYTPNVLFNLLFYPLVFFSLIGLLQVIRSQTFGQLFYIFGERSFSVYTPGIALQNIFGKNILRIYSTFSHPNAFAGYATAVLLYSLSNKKINNLINIIFAVFITISVLFSFSLSALVSAATVLLFFLIFRKYIFDEKIYKLLLISYMFLSLCLTIYSNTLINSPGCFTQSFLERLQLANTSGIIFSKHWFLGSGLNTFISSEVPILISKGGTWLLQPVHNIYLLVLTEIGCFGVFLSFYLFTKLISKNTKNKNLWFLVAIIFVLTTSLFDHYWFTSQQNLLLLSLFIGVSLRES